MTESTRTPSLYERLGGIFGISAVMEVLTDRLYENVSANRNADVQRLHETNSRAGFRFMVTAWSIEETGGPKVYPGRDMRAAHADMFASEEDFDIVALEIAATLSYCGVPRETAQEYLDIIESYRTDVLHGSVTRTQAAAVAV
ncbi:group 1 truncated hemoglobin [Streptacidiphilus sp. P02-A3a]|uniref:group I truncated hemoglobin n=1 Tax=Streptacidiphilus sp. P02-A3a TaxID=2704468 RepID=UPI0015F7FCAA|nr:group 1 truncated hemoglobin [Streptacidiphilus sp. P02-A3a]QMU67357.1 group 1 truncated hemoglobin [Streptacidiphilus sp. P02-A3a]